MARLVNPPLLEAIFELRWGETSPGEFTYSQNEQSLFAGKVSAAAALAGYKYSEGVQPSNLPAPLPMMVSHRFRENKNTWPCFQVGLGIFTANQIAEGYGWSSFKGIIGKGIDILNNASLEQTDSTRDTFTATLRYQDAFFPQKGMSVEDYLNEHFKITASLPDIFLENERIDRQQSSLNFQVNTATNTPKGQITIRIGNAIIKGEPGLLMEIIVTSKLTKVIDNKLNKASLLDWAESAHELQKHSFESLVKRSAYL